MKNTPKYPKKVPFLVFADTEGNIFEDETLEATGKEGSLTHKLSTKDFIEVPEGSEFFLLPNRIPIGFDMKNGVFRESTEGTAVAVLLAPAYVQLYTPAYTTQANAKGLPAFSYTPVAWFDGKFFATCIRIDSDTRQDSISFNPEKAFKNAKTALENNSNNTLLAHLKECAEQNLCTFAQNFFLGKSEIPLPTSSACNSSLFETDFNQNCSTFSPNADEIAEIAIQHLEKASQPIVSFGHCCNGDSFSEWETTINTIKLIRKKTKKGIVNLNTNGSNPKALDLMCKAGLDSVRITMNSFVESNYMNFNLPKNYSFKDVLSSFAIAKNNKIWTSINYLVFPGLTDTIEEFEALKVMIADNNINMIQWRNLNFSQEWYLNRLGITETHYSMGIKKLMKEIRKEFPEIVYGYFNPSKEIRH
ncbi:MAG: radical SAM protein [Bacteroidota bacterium]